MAEDGSSRRPQPTALPVLAPGGEGEPGAYAELAPHRRASLASYRRPALAAGITAGWGAVAAALVSGVGLGGWRFGWLIALGLLGIGPGVACWAACGSSVSGRGLWTTAAAILGVTAAVVTSASAPPSASRLHADVKSMGFANQFYRRIASSQRGHGWCVPRCPEVIETFRAPNGSYQEALVISLAGLHRMGLVDDLKQAYNAQRGLVIDRRGTHAHAVITVSRNADERVEVRVDLQGTR